MKKVFFLSVLSFLFLIYSCKSEPKKECSNTDNQNDTVSKKDSSETLESVMKSEKKNEPTKELKENHAKIVQKYGEQGEFCTCVLANDSINKAFGKSPSDKQAEKLMARWEYVDIKCKEFLTEPSSTPEERAIHEKKVKKCLKSRR